MTSVFADVHDEIYKYRYRGKLCVSTMVGGTPTDPRVAEGWIKTKLGVTNEDTLKEMVAKTMLERQLTAEEAVKVVNEHKNLNGFRRNPKTKQFFLESRCLKAALKEAASVAVAAGNLDARGWGKTNKGLLSYLAEHVFLTSEELPLYKFNDAGEMVPIFQFDSVEQRFIHTFRGTGIQYEEVVHDVVIPFEVFADHEFQDKEWAKIWVTGENQGIGASRSQGFGTYEVIEWERITRTGRKAPVRKAPARRSTPAKNSILTSA